MTGYLDFYGLKRAPFEVRLGKGLVLATAPLRKVLERLEAELRAATQVVVVTGPSGIGKSSLARALPQSFQDWARVARIEDPTLPWTELRGRVAVQLGLEGGRLSHSDLSAARSASGRLVLVVDGAEELSPEILDHLGVLLEHRDESGDPVLQCVMLARSDAGVPETTPVFGWLDSRSAPRVEFAPLTPGLTHSYIEKRLRYAGRERHGGELFSRAATTVVHRLSGGIPCAVNQVCDVVLLEGKRRAAERVDTDLVCEAWGEPQAAGAPSPPAGTVADAQDEARWLSPPDPVTLLIDAKGATEIATVEMAESVWAGWCEQVAASPLPGGLADEAAEAPASERTADLEAAAASETMDAAVGVGSLGECEASLGVAAPGFELSRSGWATWGAQASDAELSKSACPEDGAASPARGVRRALGWMGVAAAVLAVAAFAAVSPWPAGGSLSEPVASPASPSQRSAATAAGAGAHRFEVDTATEVSAALAPSSLAADPAPSQRSGGSPTDGLPGEIP